MFVFTVDLGISSSKDTVATSSPKTMEARAVAEGSGKNLGKEAKTKAPAARSHFFLTLSRPVPGRPGDQGTDSSAASARLDVSRSAAPENKDPSEHGALPVAAAPGPAPDKTPGCTEAKPQTLPATGPLAPSPPESQAEAPARPRDFSFLNRFFKLDKERESSRVGSHPEEAKGSEDPEQATEAPAAVPGNPHGVSAGEVSVWKATSFLSNGRFWGGGCCWVRPVHACHPTVTQGPRQGKLLYVCEGRNVRRTKPL